MTLTDKRSMEILHTEGDHHNHTDGTCSFDRALLDKAHVADLGNSFAAA